MPEPLASIPVHRPFSKASTNGRSAAVVDLTNVIGIVRALISRLKMSIIARDDFFCFINLRGGNHPASAGGRPIGQSRAPLLEWVHATRTPPQPRQRV